MINYHFVGGPLDGLEMMLEASTDLEIPILHEEPKGNMAVIHLYTLSVYLDGYAVKADRMVHIGTK